MLIRSAAVLVLSALAAVQALGQSVKLPEKLTANVGEWLIVPAEIDGGVAQWYLPDKGLEAVPLETLFGPEWAKQAKGRVFKSSTPGVYRVCAYCAKGDTASQIAVCTVTIGNPPAPVPVPPGPSPGPQPGPTPVPTPTSGFRVLLIRESKKALTRQQDAVWNSTKVIDYLNKHVAQDDGQPSWRKIDPSPTDDGNLTVDLSRDKPMIRDLWAAVKPALTGTPLPVVVVAVGPKAEIFPLPATEAEAIELLKKYGGQ